MMNRRQRRFPSQSKFALLAIGAATLGIVLSSAIIVASDGPSPGEHDALAAVELRPAAPAPAPETTHADLGTALADLAPARADLADLGVGGMERVTRPELRLGDLTPEQQNQLDKLAKKLEKYEHLEDVAGEKIDNFQALLDAAQQALLDALNLPEGTPAELNAKQAAIKKANAQLAKYGKKLTKWNTKLGKYGDTIADLTQKILEIDPDFFDGGPTETVPDPPSNLDADGGTSSVTLTWSDVDTATAYHVFWSNNGPLTPQNFSLIPNVTSPFVHANLVPGDTYYYIVTASNEEGMSPASEEVNAKVQEASAGNTGSKIGMNFVALSYYSPEWAFTDAMKQSMKWLPQEANGSTWDTGDPLTTDANGWPILGTNKFGKPEAAGTVMYRDIKGHYPAGQYVCLYEGQGTITFGFDAHIVSQEPGRIVVAVDNPTDNGIYLKITASNPSNYIRNVRLMLPGFENSSDEFHPLFLQRLAPFKVLRFMDWQHTNISKNKNWAERNTPYTQTQDDERGVAVEHMVDLCNALQADPWFCVPHLATDDYVTQFAKLVRDRLDSNLKVYIEHSNEVWNGAFGGVNGQFQYCIDKGKALGYDQGGAGIYLAGLRYHSERSVQIFNIFKSVFGGTDRLVRVLGAQGANPWTGQQIMDWKNAYQNADALAVAPYFGYALNDDPNVANMSVQQILTYLQTSIANNENPLAVQNANNAHTRGLKLVAYEAGQHLCNAGVNLTNQAVADKFIAANHHPTMYNLYMQSLNGWTAAGGDMFCAFAAWSTYSKWGSWGAMEYQDQDPSPATAPKYSAMVDYIAQQQAAAGQ